MKKTVYIFLFSILLSSLVMVSCEDDDVNDVVPRFDPEIGFRSGSIFDAIEEGDTAFFDVAIFSDRANTSNVNVLWSTTGADTRSGSITIPADGKVASFFVPHPENTTIDGERNVTVTLSTDSGIPLIEGNRSQFTYSIMDDLKVFSLGGRTIDTVEVNENQGVVNILLDVASRIDEDVTIQFEADPAGTGAGVNDYEFPDGTEFMINSGTMAPAIRLGLVNNTVLNTEERLVKVSLVSASGSPEVSIEEQDTISVNTIVYRILDDTKTFQIERLDPGVAVNNDTLSVTVPGTFSFSTSLEGANVVGVTSLEIDASSVDPELAGLFSFSEVNENGIIQYERGERSKEVFFEIDAEAFNLVGNYYITFELAGATSNVGDEDEILFNETDNSLVVEVVGQRP